MKKFLDLEGLKRIVNKVNWKNRYIGDRGWDIKRCNTFDQADDD